MALFFKIKDLCNIALTRNLHARQKLYSVSPEKWLCFAKKRFFMTWFKNPRKDYGKLRPNRYTYEI